MITLLSLLLNDNKEIDLNKCLKYALVHDLAQAIVGDITPYDGINKEEKYIIEKNGIEKLLSSLNQNLRKFIMDIWIQYEK